MRLTRSVPNWRAWVFSSTASCGVSYSFGDLWGNMRTVVATVRPGYAEQSYASTPQNAWIHVVVTMDAVTGIVTTYFNGSAASPAISEVYTAQQSFTTAWLGRSDCYMNGDPNFMGKLSDLRVFFRMLSPADVANLYTTSTTGSAPSTSSLLPSGPPPPSCAAIKRLIPSSADGWYNISTAVGPALRVWCDMTTDGGGYTYYACDGCPSVSDVMQASGCDAVGLAMVIPRSRAHWGSMYAFVQGVLGASLVSYFQAVPGIFKPSDGQQDCAGGMGVLTSDVCAGSDSWRATDGGRWWLRNHTYSEPSGDYSANCLLMFARWCAETCVGNPDDLRFNDGMCDGATGQQYLCSTNDFNTGLGPQPPSPPPSPPAPPSPSTCMPGRNRVVCVNPTGGAAKFCFAEACGL